MFCRTVIRNTNHHVARRTLSSTVMKSTGSVLTSNNYIAASNSNTATGFRSSNDCRWKSSSAAAATSEAPASSSKVTDEVQEKKAFVPTPEREYQYFENVEINDDGVAIVRIDCSGKKVNTISFDMADEAKLLFEKVNNNDKVKAIVVTSAKEDNFIVGADIFDIKDISKQNPDDLLPIIADGIEFFQSMQKNKIPVVCAIHGNCLGGGLEWALWCDYRICTDSDKTQMGLPEVKLGLLPGFGGTQNLHALVGLQNAMDMMLTGKNIRPKKAKQMGLVDLVVQANKDVLEKVACDTAKQLASGELKIKRKPKSFVNKLLEDNPIGRSFIWKEIDKLVAKNTNGNYPAPYAIIQCVKHGIDNPKTKFENERKQFAKLASTSESKALISIFEGMTQMKKHNFTLDKDESTNVNSIAVLGAGLMGAGIAQVSVQKGYNVLLKDRDDASVQRGVQYMTDDWKKKLKRKRMTQYQYNIHSSNVTPLTDDSSQWKHHFNKSADLIIEAVFEDLSLKQQIVADMEETCRDSTIFATNTSAIPIRDIAAKAKRPENIIGMHYFSPVPAMPLLEIIPHDLTSNRAKAMAYEVGTKQGKTCIVVKDVPGFYVNRCLGPFMTEASALAQDGVSLEQMDKAIKNFGMPVGPITLFDEVGIDVAYKVAKYLKGADLGTRMDGGDIGILEEMVNRGYLGKKTNKGFYTYDKKGGKGKKKYISDEVKQMAKEFVQQDLKLEEKEIQDRMVCRFINEAAKCLEDEIIENPTVGDIGLIFGVGFAPFRGGPFHYLDQMGVTSYVEMMMRFRDKYGIQFEPCDLLQDYAKTNKKFFND